MSDWKEKLKFDQQGLIPVVVQEEKSRQVLMLAYMNREALEKTLQTKRAHYFSRSRQSLWLKGETSGHFQEVKAIDYDCDEDALLMTVKQTGPACHTGEKSCFYRRGETTGKRQDESVLFLQELYEVIEKRRENPHPDSYTSRLLSGRIDRLLKKIGEESTEVLLAAKNDSSSEIIYEMADLWYHCLVMLVLKQVTVEQVAGELSSRHEGRE